MKTLVEFIVERQQKIGGTGHFTRIMNDIGIAAKIVNREINRAGLTENVGFSDDTNIQGERQKKLDVFANNEFVSALRSGGACCAILSEENDQVIELDNDISQQGNYVIAMDPLDGSSNIESNVSVGTIFAIYRRTTESGPGKLIDLLQPGKNIIAAGYILYGSSTMLVYSTIEDGNVNGFTLDPTVGIFILSHPNMTFPDKSKIYSINESNYPHFDTGIQKYLQYLKSNSTDYGDQYTSRYIGSLVSDFHRNLIRGGIFIYPKTKSNVEGKLRLLYECNPIAFLAEKAGGKAIDGKGNRILDIIPKNIHQRSPLLVGHSKMIEKAEEFINN